MSEPLEYPSATPRHTLPLLFFGQSQKEMFVNAALGLCDALLHPAIEGEVPAPPASPVNGECWLVAAGASGGFAGREGELASYQNGTWVFAQPRDGMRVLDRSTGQHVLFAGSWRRENAVPLPSGGTTIDVEARAAFAQLIEVMSRTGILPSL